MLPSEANQQRASDVILIKSSSRVKDRESNRGALDKSSERVQNNNMEIHPQHITTPMMIVIIIIWGLNFRVPSSHLLSDNRVCPACSSTCSSSSRVLSLSLSLVYCVL